MNFKYLLIAFCIIAATPNINAMRYTRPIFLAHGIQQVGLPAIAAGFNRHKRSALECIVALKPTPSVFSGMGCAGDALLATTTQEEEYRETLDPVYVSIENLNIYDIQGVAYAFEHAHPVDQSELARSIAQNITQYKTSSLITLLQTAQDRPRLILAKAISKNITRYSTLEITAMLKVDRSEQTQLLIANALKNNYSYFTQRSFMGISLYSSKEWRTNYLEMIKTLQYSQQRIAIEPVLTDIHQYNVLDILSRTDVYLKKTVLEAFSRSNKVNIHDYGDDRYVMHVLELTRPYDQTHIAQQLARDIAQYNEWHFAGFLKSCNDAAKNIISEAIARDVRNNPTKYKNDMLVYVQKLCSAEQKSLISSALSDARECIARSCPIYYYGSLKQQ